MLFSEKSIALVAIFLIVSAKPVYAITSTITDKIGLPTIQYGSPTRFGLLLHAIVLAALYAWVANRV